MKYQYSTAMPPSPHERWTKRPMITVEIFGKNCSKKFSALIDSGADYSLFNIQIAKLLELDLSKARSLSFIGIGGKQQLPAFLLDDVEIKVEGADKSVKIPVGFIDSESVGLLLGQNGFFDKYRIKFEKDHDVFELNLVK